jgi:hypothetical protein
MGSNIGLEAAQKREQVPPQYNKVIEAKLPERFATAVSPVREERPALSVVVAPEEDSSFEIAEEADAVPVVELELEPEIEALADADSDVTPGAVNLPEQEEDHVGAAHEEDHDKTRIRTFQAQDMAADGKDLTRGVNGFQTIGPYANRAGDLSAAKRQEEEDKKFTQSILKKQLDQYLKWLDGEIERLGKDIAKADSLIIHLNNGGTLEVNEDGELVDEDAERLLREYTERTGNEVDRNDTAAILRALEEQRRFMFQQQQDYQHQRDREAEFRQKIESGEISTMDDLRREAPLFTEAEKNLAAAQASKTSVETTAAIAVAQGHEEQVVQRVADLASENSGGGGFAKKKGGTSVAQNSEGNVFTVAPISGAFANARDGAQNTATTPALETNPDAVITPKLA